MAKQAQERSTGDPKEQHFESIAKELQTIVEKLENSELSLEESIHLFERGMNLAQRGQTILDAAERKVEILLKDGQTEPFNPEKIDQG